MEVEDAKVMPCALMSLMTALVRVGWDVNTVDLGDIISFSLVDILAKETIASTSPRLTSAFETCRCNRYIVYIRCYCYGWVVCYKLGDTVQQECSSECYRKLATCYDGLVYGYVVAATLLELDGARAEVS